MEILLASASAIVIEGYKWLSNKYGVGPTKQAIYFGLFILAIIWTVLTRVTNIVTPDSIKLLVEYFLFAIGIYEAIIKTGKKWLGL